jgi:hypothetical protein
MSNKQTNSQHCTWAIPNFPRALKNRYIAYLKSNNVSIRNHLEYLISKTVLEAGLKIPEINLKNLVKKLSENAKTD